MRVINQLTNPERSSLQTNSKRLKSRIIEVAGSKGGHFGGAFSCLDILLFLYKHILSLDKSNPNYELRDRFIMSKGHSVLSLYAILEDIGLLRNEEFESYLTFESRIAGHAEHFHIPWIEMSTGSLGHGAPSGCGIALSAKMKGLDWNVYVLVGDGELNEGSNWEAFMFASQHNLSNYVLLVDNNGMESLDQTSEILGVEPLDLKFKSFGFSVYTCDGHDFDEISSAFRHIALASDSKPKVIIFKTKKGNGVSFMSDNPMWHYRELRGDQRELAMRELKTE